MGLSHLFPVTILRKLNLIEHLLNQLSIAAPLIIVLLNHHLEDLREQSVDMVAQYTVFGRQVGSHILAIATLGTTFAGAALAMGGDKKSKQQGPPIQAQSSEEESFIKDFMQKAESEEKAKH
ncbi:MAG: hypothetical protein M1824_003513 [Vezdaea acicularis]|nr:MAG: hypothetical protein M1824_003513 [Vezdaea acicularis]